MDKLIKKYLKISVFLLMLSHDVFAVSGLLFNVSATGTPADVSLSLCLNGKGPLSCQLYHVTALNVKICAVPNHFYANAGIKINTPGYTLDNLGVDCQPYSNRYCLFPVSNTACTNLSISKTSSNTPLVAAGSYFALFPAVATNNEGVTWNAGTASGSIGSYNLASTSCIGAGSNAFCTAAGYDLNTGRPILYQSTNGGKSWALVPTGTNQGIFYSTSCSGSFALCVAAGLDTTTGLPLLYQSTNGGNSWSAVITGITTPVSFNATSCSNSLCTAVGRDSTTNLPIIYQTTNGGSSWSEVTTGITNTGNFTATSCSTNWCTAAGEDNTTGLPILYQTTNGGSSWSVVPTGITNTGFFIATSCSGTVCITAGKDIITDFPLLYQSTDGGVNWSASNTGITNPGIFRATSCSGTGSSALCVAAGQDGTTGFPWLYQSVDGGVNWSAAPTGITSPGQFNATSCSTSGSTTICTVVGQVVANLSSALPIIYQSTDRGISWSAVSTGIEDQGNFFATSCSGTTCATVGAFENIPLLSVSVDQGTNWSAVPTISYKGFFSASSCSGSGSNALCTAAGYEFNTGLPLLYQSTDGGNSWNAAPTGITARGYFTATSCSGQVTTGLCTAAGFDSVTNLPLLFQSTNGGSNWSAVPTGISIISSIFLATSCSGTGSNALCTAAGGYGITQAPLLYQSTNGGSSWNAVTVLTNLGIFNATSCTGIGSTALCTAAGQDVATNLPLLYQTTDGGSNWSEVVTGITDLGFFKATSCSGTGSNAVCTASGQDATTQRPLLYQSTNGGTSWSSAPIGITGPGVFNTASCSGSGNSSICIAAGQDLTTFNPLLYQSTDGGSSWSIVPTGTNQGVFNASSCSGSGRNTVCTASGQDTTTQLPLLYLSRDGGNNWSSITAVKDQGVFNATSTTGP